MNDQLTEVYASIDALIDYALAHLDLDPRIFALFRLDSYPGPKTTTSAASVSDVVQDIVGSRSQAPYGEKTPAPLLAAFRAAATTAGLFKPEEGPAYADTIMGILSANPADLDDRFLLVEHRDGGMAAMQWFYDYCVANNYVKRAQLDRNPRRLARADGDHQPRQTRIQEHEEGGGRQRRGRRLPEVHDLS